MANNRKGNDFSSTVRIVLGKRVGFRCSNPTCRISTIEPNSDPGKATDIGEAAHICAASVGGPRYDENMTSGQRKSADNGIFLCSNCHTKIDKDPGKYPVKLLRSWKEAAEKNIETKYVLTSHDANQKEALRIYYESLVEEFEEKKDTFIGDESLKDSYIMPMIGDDSMLDLIWDWFEKEDYGVFLLYGQPGHGKTTICKKVVYDYVKAADDYMEKALVLQFPLNQSKSQLISFSNNSISIENTFRNMPEGESFIKLINCKGKLIFLDGFDEIKYLLEEHVSEYGTYQKFEEYLFSVAKKYRIHFVVTTRINALEPNSLKKLNSLEFPNLTAEQQTKWCSRREDYEKRWKSILLSTDISKDKNGTLKDIKELLQIPYIFRMVVHNNYRLSNDITNKAALFADLFKQTIGRNSVHSRIMSLFDINKLSQGYQELAYKIWCDDEDSAKDVENSNILMLAYYIKENIQYGRYSFIHKSFYDYYMALYLFCQIKKCSNASWETGETFLAKLAERRIDNEIFSLFEDMIKNSQEKDVLLSGAKCILNVLDSSEAIGIDKKKKDEIIGTAIRSRYIRCNTIFFNTICLAIVAGEKELINYKNILKLLTEYNCEGMILRAANLSEISLRNGRLHGVDLRNANLRKIEFSETDIIGADFGGADIYSSDFSQTSLKVVDFSDAQISETSFNAAKLFGTSLKNADLSETDFSFASLDNVDLSGANLCNADLRWASFNNIDFSKANLTKTRMLISQKEIFNSMSNVDTHDIIWCDEETGEPIGK